MDCKIGHLFVIHYSNNYSNNFRYKMVAFLAFKAEKIIIFGQESGFFLKTRFRHCFQLKKKQI